MVRVFSFHIYTLIVFFLHGVKKTNVDDDQGLDFDDMSSLFPCEIDDAIQYINLGYGAQAQKIVFFTALFVILCS